MPEVNAKIITARVENVINYLSMKRTYNKTKYYELISHCPKCFLKNIKSVSLIKNVMRSSNDAKALTRY